MCIRDSREPAARAKEHAVHPRGFGHVALTCPTIQLARCRDGIAPSANARARAAGRESGGRVQLSFRSLSLLSSRVAIAANGGQADLRPALIDYLFLAAACHGTT